MGRARGMPPKREPMVSTGTPKIAVNAVAPMSRTTVAGATRLQAAGHRRRRSRPPVDIRMAGHCAVSRLPARVFTIAKNSAGTFSTWRPRKSRIWARKMRTAMPLVKPTITGWGTNLIKPPRRKKPIAMSIAPAISVQITRFATPYRSTMP